MIENYFDLSALYMITNPMPTAKPESAIQISLK